VFQENCCSTQPSQIQQSCRSGISWYLLCFDIWVALMFFIRKIVGCWRHYFTAVTSRNPKGSICPKCPAKWNPTRVWFRFRHFDIISVSALSKLLLLKSRCTKDLFSSKNYPICFALSTPPISFQLKSNTFRFSFFVKVLNIKHPPDFVILFQCKYSYFSLFFSMKIYKKWQLWLVI
jgi:hypothetical protein